MASIQRRGKKWLAEVRTKGVYRSKRFNSKNEALQWSLSIEQELGKHGDLVKGRTLGDAFEKYAKEVSPTKKGCRWEVVRLTKLKRDKIVDIQLLDLKPRDLEGWIGRQTTSPGSIRRELNLIGSVLRQARVKWKWIQDDIMKDIDKPSDRPPRDRRISAREIELILKALGYEEGRAITARDEIAIAFLFALETAMRQGEIWGLQWPNINILGKYAVLPETKNGSLRSVALSRRAIELLRYLGPKESGPIFNVKQRVAEVMFRAAVKTAKIENLKWHDTRHQAITQLAQKLEVLDLARMVGHRDVKSLLIYYNATATEIAEKLD